MRKRVLVGCIAVVVVLCSAVVVQRARRRDTPGATLLGGTGPAANAAIDAFFDRYVEADGRVVRRDQGGDTVSEGQAYALLLAVAQGNRPRFDRVWAWTKGHLQRPDGLLSWKWDKGRVVDPSPASDADLDTARALVRAGTAFQHPAFQQEGVRLSRAVLDHETIDLGGRMELAAGPWAVERRIVNPSYVSPCTYAELQLATGDARWQRLIDGGLQMIDALTSDGRLPPDWAQLDQQGAPRAIGGPDEPGQPGQYGLDAARVPFRLAEGCDDKAQALASRLWEKLSGLEGGGARSAYRLDGAVVDGKEHPVGLVAAAAAARASREDGASKRLLRQARTLDRRTPTYYGSAWVALGDALLHGQPGRRDPEKKG